MLQNAYLLAKIGADTAENEQHFAKNLRKTDNPTGPGAAQEERHLQEPAGEERGTWGEHLNFPYQIFPRELRTSFSLSSVVRGKKEKAGNGWDGPRGARRTAAWPSHSPPARCSARPTSLPVAFPRPKHSIPKMSSVPLCFLFSFFPCRF